jgi:hypothetical protein
MDSIVSSHLTGRCASRTELATVGLGLLHWTLLNIVVHTDTQSRSRPLPPVVSTVAHPLLGFLAGLLDSMQWLGQTAGRWIYCWKFPVLQVPGAVAGAVAGAGAKTQTKQGKVTGSI